MERDNEQLVARIQAGEDVAKNMLKLYNQNQGFLAKTAKRYQGLAEFVAFWIRQGMKRYIDNCGSAIRLPVSAREEVYKYHRVVKEYRKYNGGFPSDSALCRLLGVSREKLQEIRENVQIGQVQSLSEVLGGDGEDITLEDTIASDQDLEGDAVEAADAAAMKRELWIAVDRLPGELPEVIRRRYIDGQTLSEIGKDLDLKYERVRQSENKALRTLKEPGLSRKYHKYYEEYIAARSYQHVGVASFMRTGLSEVELEVLGWIR